MKDVYFIILNYNTAKETIGCINSIKNLQSQEFGIRIIIIDNFSPDGSFQILYDTYAGDNNVELFQMKENQGFSKANNYGYQLVKKRKNVAFCIVCNSDIEFIQKDFLCKLKEEYTRSLFFICGPDIYCEARKNTYCKGHQSPFYPFEWDKRYLSAYYKYYKFMAEKIKKTDKYSLKSEIAIQLAWKWQCVIRRIKVETVYRHYREKYHDSLPIHGSCIILSDLFLNSEDVLFWPEVKFYGEELFLFLRICKNKYKQIYSPKLRVLHHQGRATSSIKEKELFRYENYAIAAGMYLQSLKASQKNVFE